MTRYLGRLAFIVFSTQFCFWYALHAFRPYRLSPSQAAVRVLKGQSHLKGLSYFKSFITCAGSILTSLKPSTGFTTNCCSKSSTDSASAVALLTWFEDYLTDCTSKGSPLSESKARLSLCHQACGKDQYLDLSCSSYMWLNDLPVTWRPLFLSLPMTRGASGKWKAWRMVLAYNVTSNTSTHDVISARGWGGGGYFGNFWVGMCSWDPGTHNLNQS